MLISTIIAFAQATALSSIHEDIIVFLPCSGEVSCFNDLEWPTSYGKETPDSIIKKIGYGMIDETYTFIWIHRTID